MGGGGKKRVDTSAMDAQLARQEERIRQQEEKLAQREAQIQQEEEARKRARVNRASARALLLGGSEMGTSDQPLPESLRKTLGG